MKLLNTKKKKILAASFVVAVIWASVEFWAKRQIEQCLENALIWDYDENRCRDDCLKWGEGFGCIKLTAEETATIKECRFKTDCITNDMIRTICLRNGKAYNEGNRNCRYDFKPELCYKLSGTWTYPELCDE